MIFVDPQALATCSRRRVRSTIPRSIGPGGLDGRDYLANEAYGQFGSAAERKRVLGAAVLSVLRRFLETDPVASFRALADAGAGGHLIVHSTDPEVQAALEAAGVAGTVEAPQAGDLFGAFASNADGTKIDFYVRRSLSYRVDLGEGGGSTARGGAHGREHGAHRSRGYVFGPYPGTGLEPGVSQAFVSMYCAPGCGFQDATLDGKPQDLELTRERGLGVLDLRADRAGAHERTGAPAAARGCLDRGRARRDLPARIRAQQTVLPTRGTITIQAPPGTDIVDATPGHAGRRRPGDVGGRPRRRAGLRDPVPAAAVRPLLGLALDAGVRGLRDSSVKGRDRSTIGTACFQTRSSRQGSTIRFLAALDLDVAERVVRAVGFQRDSRWSQVSEGKATIRPESQAQLLT